MNESNTARRRPAHAGWVLTALIAVAALAACTADPNPPPLKTSDKPGQDSGSILGPGGLFGGPAATKPADNTGLGVNAFLWRASLDTVSVWPITSADPFGGVILTDWYAPPATPSERFKLNVYIIDRALRADGVRVAVFRQVRSTTGEWQNATVQPDVGSKLEDAILMRARQMRNLAAQGQ